jgi:hypothetical protein
MAAFTEPSRRLPLRWGRYADRYVAGLLYIFAGGFILLSTNTYTVVFLLVGTVAHVGGWFILPAKGSRRLIAFGPSLIALFLQLTGPQITGAMAVMLLVWLLVRERPLRSYVVLLFPLVSGFLLANAFHTNQNEPLALGIEVVVVVLSAWLGRYLATTRAPRPTPKSVSS